MKISVKSLMFAALCMMTIISGVLLCTIGFSSIASSIKILLLLLVICLIVACFFFYWLISKRLNASLVTLSQTIQKLIDDGSQNDSQELDDTILSKIHSQMIKLSNILKAHSERQQKEKERITSLISDISHQLKTPLANLNMYHSLLLNRDLTEEKRTEFTENMQSQLLKLNGLMESLIKMSRLETGIISLNKAQQPIAETVLKAISMMTLKAERKNIQITFAGDESLKITHDATWTQEAILNVLDNGVKYSPPGSLISVCIDHYELFCRIDITDNGYGIPETDINNIFKRFYRGKNAKDSEGVGIGLFLARQIIAEQGGYIKVKSATGKGTVFSLFLPTGFD